MYAKIMLKNLVLSAHLEEDVAMIQNMDKTMAFGEFGTASDQSSDEQYTSVIY